MAEGCSSRSAQNATSQHARGSLGDRHALDDNPLRPTRSLDKTRLRQESKMTNAVKTEPDKSSRVSARHMIGCGAGSKTSAAPDWAVFVSAKVRSGGCHPISGIRVISMSMMTGGISMS